MWRNGRSITCVKIFHYKSTSCGLHFSDFFPRSKTSNYLPFSSNESVFSRQAEVVVRTPGPFKSQGLRERELPHIHRDCRSISLTECRLHVSWWPPSCCYWQRLLLRLVIQFPFQPCQIIKCRLVSEVVFSVWRGWGAEWKTLHMCWYMNLALVLVLE